MTMFDKSDAREEMARQAATLESETAEQASMPEPAPAAEAAIEPMREPGPAHPGAAGEGEMADEGETADGGDTAAASRHVPFTALKAERLKRQQIERDLHTLQGQVKAWQNAMMAQLQSGEAAVEEPPNAEQDPVGALRYTQQQLAQLQSAVAQQVRSQQLQSAYVAGATEFSRGNPDFAEAYNHMIQSRANELRVLGAPEAAIARQLRIEEEQMVAASVSAGRNPAEVAYAAARARGWQPRGSSGKPPAGNAAGAALANGRASAATALSSGGRAQREAISAEDLSRLSGRDFDAGWEKLFGRRGGRGNAMFAGR